MIYLGNKILQLTWIWYVLPSYATVAVQQLPELSKLCQQEVFTILMGHPVQTSKIFRKIHLFGGGDLVDLALPSGL